MKVAWAVVGLVALAGCGLSPRAYCETVSQTTCSRLFACLTGEPERSALLAMYADEATCTKSFTTRSACETQTEASYCRSNKWVPANAAACVEELPCDQLSTYRPTCAPPCQAP